MNSRTLNMILAVIAVGVCAGTIYLGFTTAPEDPNAQPAALKQRQSSSSGRQPQAAPAAETSGPPANAQFVGTDPSEVMFSIVGIRNPDERKRVGDSWKGKWVPNEGWDGEVVDVSREFGKGYSIRMYFTQQGILGGGYYVVCVVPNNDKDVRKGDRARVQGEIDRVEELEGGAAPIFRIVLIKGTVIDMTPIAPR